MDKLAKNPGPSNSRFLKKGKHIVTGKDEEK